MTSTNATITHPDQSAPTRTLPTVESTIGEVQAILEERFDAGTSVRVLEAGCGSCGHFDVGSDAYMIGIDISQKQLDRNDRLDERICGDLEARDMTEHASDLVVCWYVLEHLRRPDRAMVNLADAVSPGGRLVVAVPNVWSFKGMLTKFTPHWFHVAVYRHVLGRKDAGRHDTPPFPAHLRWSIRPRELCRLGESRGLRTVVAREFEDYTQHKLRGERWWFSASMRVIDAVWRIGSLGRRGAYLTDVAIVMERPEGADA